MIALFQWLMYGHTHKWKIIDSREVRDDECDRLIGKRYTCQCEYCGTIKTFNNYTT